jgi:hypothetical protein
LLVLHNSQFLHFFLFLNHDEHALLFSLYQGTSQTTHPHPLTIAH